MHRNVKICRIFTNRTSFEIGAHSTKVSICRNTIITPTQSETPAQKHYERSSGDSAVLRHDIRKSTTTKLSNNTTCHIRWPMARLCDHRSFVSNTMVAHSVESLQGRAVNMKKSDQLLGVPWRFPWLFMMPHGGARGTVGHIPWGNTRRTIVYHDHP